MEKYESQRLEAFGLLKSGTPIRDVVRKLNIPYSTVLRWSKTVAELETSEDLSALMNTDKVVVHKLAEQIQSEFDVLVDDADVLIGEVVKKIDGMQLLSEKLTDTSITLVNKLQAMAMVCTDPKDVQYLVESVSKLQLAFFAKGTNVQVNVATPSADGVSKFKTLARSA